MMLFKSSFLVATSLATVISAHGIVTSPPVRAVGPAMIAACGSAVADLVTADNTSHVEGMPEAAAATPNFNGTACNVFQCKGLQFADNVANVQTFTPGQVVNIRASIPIPHEGPCNVSVVDTASNAILGEPMIVFDSYADESLPALPANNTNFNITMPTTLGNKCAVAGACVVQWFWFGTGAQQTYESCVDFTLQDTAASGAASTAAVATSPAPAIAAVKEGSAILGLPFRGKRWALSL